MTKTANPQFDQMSETAFKQMDEAGEALRQTVDAVMQSGHIVAENASVMNQSYVAMMQQMAEKNNIAMRDMMSAKTLDDIAQKQGDMAQQNMQEWMTLMTKMSEAGVKAMMDAGEPLSRHMNASMANAKK